MLTLPVNLRSCGWPFVFVSGLTVLIAGCNSTNKMTPSATRPAGVCPLDLSGFDDPVDRERLALSRFIGAWDFEGWYDPPGEPRRETAGLAAGTVESKYFVLLDTARVVIQGSEKQFITGAILLSAEPGIGLMLTSWSQQSPAVHRFRGQAEAEGSRFVFEQVTADRGQDRLRLVMRFETDDRWVAEFYRRAGGKDLLAASYTFIRAA